ncbi:hypothetical protein EMCG_00240 [[Emmonsia] crescens]|uniref:Uncharacterized protein n=1 Tax=[Emmonsia] crescens TaxID=73230 RepID=A0A0G2I114_9EURO|nr:hypothetical protein EMCG_00240 [Emmonsia crescens UAMH 3008]
MNLNQHQSLIFESVKMQKLSELLQKIIHSAVKHINELNKLFVHNNLLKQILISMQVFRAEREKLKRKECVVIKTFINTMQNMIREYK